jgi:hypothetical protein
MHENRYFNLRCEITWQIPSLSVSYDKYFKHTIVKIIIIIALILSIFTAFNFLSARGSVVG